jgi:hypothetical protein
MERRLKSGREMMSKLPDLIEKSSRIPIVNEVMPTDLEAAQLAGDQNLRTLAGAIEEYRRIVKEFDRLVDAAHAVHDAHIQTLRTIDLIQGNVPATGALVVPQPRSDPTAAAAMPRVTSLSSPSIGRAAGFSN